jgi:hypothetical protein
LTWAIGGGAAVALLLVILILVFALRSPSTDTKGIPVGPAVFHVSKEGGNGAFTKIGDVLRELKKTDQGGRIILDSDIEEQVVVSVPRVTIEAGRGKKVVWKAPQSLGPNQNRLILLFNVNEFRLQGSGSITLDGDGRLDSIVNVGGACSGTVVDGVTLQGFTKYGVWVTNCMGGANTQRVWFGNLTFKTNAKTQTAFFFELRPDLMQQFPRNANILLREPLEIEGPGQKVTAFTEEAVRWVEMPAGWRPNAFLPPPAVAPRRP